MEILGWILVGLFLMAMGGYLVFRFFAKHIVDFVKELANRR